MGERFEQVATRHGDYYHALPPGTMRAMCGLRRPVFPAKTIGHRQPCPRCAAVIGALDAALSQAAAPPPPAPYTGPLGEFGDAL